MNKFTLFCFLAGTLLAGLHPANSQSANGGSNDPIQPTDSSDEVVTLPGILTSQVTTNPSDPGFGPGYVSLPPAPDGTYTGSFFALLNSSEELVAELPNLGRASVTVTSRNITGQVRYGGKSYRFKGTLNDRGIMDVQVRQNGRRVRITVSKITIDKNDGSYLHGKELVLHTAGKMVVARLYQ